MFPVDAGIAFIFEIAHDDGGAVVDEMHEDGGPDGARVVENVAQEKAEEHSRQEAVELEMDERENEGAEEHGDVHIAPLGEGLLQHAAEGQFLADGGDEGDDQKVS